MNELPSDQENEKQVIKKRFVEGSFIPEEALSIELIKKTPMFLIKLEGRNWPMIIAADDGMISKVAETLGLIVEEALELLSSEESSEMNQDLKKRLITAILHEYDFVNATIYSQLYREGTEKVEVIGMKNKNMYRVSRNDGKKLWGNTFPDFGVDTIMKGDDGEERFVAGIRRAF